MERSYAGINSEYDADFPCVYYVQPSNALGKQDHHKVITLEVPLWPWFNQKLIFQSNCFFICVCLLCLLVFQINKFKFSHMKKKDTLHKRRLTIAIQFIYN